MNTPLLDVRNLKVYFSLKKKGFLRRGIESLRAVDDVSWSISEGETLGIVGESGCGKTTVARALLRLVNSNGGEAFFQGKDIMKMSERDFHSVRRNMQMIFQDPYDSLDPRRTVGSIIGEPLAIFEKIPPRARNERVVELMEMVGLRSEVLHRFPHQFSGGQRQRISIARALTLNPKLILCDEAVSALDVSIQAQILALLKDLQKRLHLAYVFISHDLGVVRYLSHSIAVMYLGRIVERGKSSELFEEPLHPYTQGLLASIPLPDPGREYQGNRLSGDLPSPVNPPSGCPFHPRCPEAISRCSEDVPLEREVLPGRFCRCHLR